MQKRALQNSLTQSKARIKTGRIFALDQIDLAECCFLLVSAVEQTNQALNALEYRCHSHPKIVIAIKCCPLRIAEHLPAEGLGLKPGTVGISNHIQRPAC
jgi:hypothetical protein